ncbi:MAG: chemotaxis protein CheA [Acidimicrobiales bacterium]
MDEEYAEVISEFLIESYENLDRLVQDLLDLEGDPAAAATLASAFRTVHTIKGTCGFLGYDRLERVTHVGENLLSRLRDGELALEGRMVTALLRLADAVREMLASIESTGADGENDFADLVDELGRLTEGQAATAVPAVAPAVAPVGEVLVAAGSVAADDVALALAEQDLGDGRPIGQILVDHGSAQPTDVDAAVLTQLGQSSGTPPADGRASIADSTIRVDVGVLDRLMNLVGELVLSRNNVVQHVGANADPASLAASQQLDLVTGELQECVMKTRMQPIGSVWSKFTRVVRDLAVQCDKQVRIEMEGEDTELDKTIIEAIKDPLTHVVRNTVDHGIEPAEQRVAAGKPAEGVLHMKAHHEGGQVIIEIADDGAGIDPDRVKAKAVARGLITEAAANTMTDHEAIALIFAPGFSTAETVTNVSGRGVGMDVVKTNIERIGGSVEVESELGAGTTLRVRIPLTLAIIPALMIESDGHQFAIPQVEVLELVRLAGDQVQSSVEMLHTAPVYRLRGNLLPLVYLREVLGFEPSDPDATLTIAVVSTDNRSWGLVIDGVTTTEEIVVKPLGRILRSVPAFSGATIMGDGRVSLILDIARIAKRSRVVAAAEAARAHDAGTQQIEQGVRTKLLVVTRGDEQLAIDVSEVDRLEQFGLVDLERSGSLDVVQYRDGILPLVRLGSPAAPTGGEKELTTVVFEREGRLVGLVVEQIVDIVEAPVEDSGAGRSTVVVRDRVTEMLDLDDALVPADAWFQRSGIPRNDMAVAR